MDTPSEITSLKRNRPKKLLAPKPFGIKKLFHRSSNFDDVSLYRKMTGIEELHLRIRQVLSKCLCSRRNEERKDKDVGMSDV